MILTPLHQAKRRTRRRRDEAGAVMFVVSMMITVLAAVGMFALAAAATEVRTAGNERQNAQTHFLSQYGVLALARETESGQGPAILSLMLNNTVQCLALPVPSPTYVSGGRIGGPSKACARLYPGDLQKIGSWGAGVPPVETYAGPAYNTSIAKPGSLGPVPIDASFFVEVTMQGPGKQAAGNSTGMSWVILEATSYGVTRPLISAGNYAYGAEGMEVQRARLLVGPMPGQ
jgi:hypothetical protein